MDIEYVRTPIHTPDVPNGGSRIALKKPVDSLQELLDRRIVTRQDLERSGFIVVNGAGGPPEQRQGEKVLKDATTVQLIHQDMPPPEDPSVLNVVVLRRPAREKPRGAVTMIGDQQQVLRRL